MPGKRPSFTSAPASARRAHLGGTDGDAVAYQVIGWLDGDFNRIGATSDRETTTLSTTGLLMEAMRLMDEANQSVGS